MSPRFSRARPSTESASLNRASVMPASTVALPVVRSTSSTRCMLSSDRCNPSVRAAPVNECPAPYALTRCPSAAAPLTRAASSSSSDGAPVAAGAQAAVPAQFDQRDRDAAFAMRRNLALQRLDELGHDLVHVAHDAEVGDREDRGLGVLVHGDDVLRSLHP